MTPGEDLILMSTNNTMRTVLMQAEYALYMFIHYSIITNRYLSSYAHPWVTARCEVCTAMKIHIVVFWVVTPCRDEVGYQRFGGPYSLYLQGEVVTLF